MVIFSVIYFKIVLILFAFSINANLSSGLECFIHNREYSYEYFYNENEQLNDFERYLNLNVFTTHLSKITNYKRITWEVISNLKKRAIYFKNKATNHYLCASNLYMSSMKVRRTLYTSNEKQGDNCLWKLNQILKIKPTRNETRNDEDFSKNTYLIWNLKYNQQLYAPSFFFKSNKYRRNVYLWHDKKENLSNKFRWIMDCM
jgi:hypothetical protein